MAQLFFPSAHLSKPKGRRTETWGRREKQDPLFLCLIEETNQSVMNSCSWFAPRYTHLLRFESSLSSLLSPSASHNDVPEPRLRGSGHPTSTFQVNFSPFGKNLAKIDSGYGPFFNIFKGFDFWGCFFVFNWGCG